MIWLVVLAGALGAVGRYLVEGAVQQRFDGRFPLGTFVVNVSGSLLLGFVAGLVLYHGVSDDVRVAAGTGFLGSYTTFSTLTLETFRLFEDGAVLEGTLNVVGSAAVGLGAAAAGIALAAVC